MAHPNRLAWEFLPAPGTPGCYTVEFKDCIKSTVLILLNNNYSNNYINID